MEYLLAPLLPGRNQLNRTGKHPTVTSQVPVRPIQNHDERTDAQFRQSTLQPRNKRPGMALAPGILARGQEIDLEGSEGFTARGVRGLCPVKEAYHDAQRTSVKSRCIGDGNNCASRGNDVEGLMYSAVAWGNRKS